MASEQYDFIIVGGGSAGCVLANRLSANPSNRVLVLEAGRPDYRLDFRLHMPAALTYPLAGRTYNWWYESEPEPGMNGRRIYQPRGKVLGGSSTVNGMIYIRGNPLDYDGWAKKDGLESWSFADCLPYFQRVESRLVGADEFHGVGGPLALTTPECDNPLFKAFFGAVEEAGYKVTDDVNGYRQEGFGRFDRTTYLGRRHNAARAWLHPVKNRENLNVRTKAHVNRVVFEGSRAVGVEVGAGSGVRTYRGGEILLCGGAIGSPQVLQLSGIGNPEELQTLGIEPVHELPNVGEHLRDHLEVYVQHACKQPVSLYPSLKWYNQPGIGYRWLFYGDGAGASNHFEAGGFIRTNDEVAYPNVQYHFLPIAIRYDGTAPAQGHGFQCHVGPVLSDALGSVKIQSADPRVYPRVLFNYLSTDKDRREWVEAIRATRNILSRPAFDDLRGEELAPGEAVQSDEEILDFIAREGESAYHPSCTCRMGTDDDAVVDEEFRVHGLQGLRVIDAAAMPEITNGNIYAPVLMMAEKAADQILGNTLLGRSNADFYRHPGGGKGES
jgi:choline dehydrogenase